MGYDCTLHVIDPEAIREIYCRKLLGLASDGLDFGEEAKSQKIWKKLREIVGGDDSRSAAAAVAEGAILFSAAVLPAHYERGFCLSLWADCMEDEAMIAEVPGKHRGLAADLDELFAPIVGAHPKLKGHWPTDLTGNGSVGIYIPKEKVSGLLKWARNKIKTYPRPSRRIFRGLLLVLEECQRRGLAYWEATDVAEVKHPIHLPKEFQPAWLDDAVIPAKGYWELIALANTPDEPPRCVFVDTLGGIAQTVFADLTSWPPVWNRIDETLNPCDCSRDGIWLVVSRRPGNGTRQSGLRTLELRADFKPFTRSNQIPQVLGSWKHIRSEFVTPSGEPADIDLQFAGIMSGLPIVLLSETACRPHVLRNGRFRKAEELPADANDYKEASVVRLPDGGEVLIWRNDGFQLVGGRLEPTFKVFPDGWHSEWPSKFCAIGDDAILCSAGEGPPDKVALRSALFLARRGAVPKEVAPAAQHLAFFSPGPMGSALARQMGRAPKHLGCILWPEAGPGGTLIWLEDSVFPDEDPDHMRQFLWSEPAGKLIAVTRERLWAVDADYVLSLPRYDATSGKRLKNRS